MAVQRFQCLALLCGFYAFGNELNAKLLGEGHGCFDDGINHWMINLLNKLFVEFDHIKRQDVQTA